MPFRKAADVDFGVDLLAGVGFNFKFARLQKLDEFTHPDLCFIAIRGVFHLFSNLIVENLFGVA